MSPVSNNNSFQGHHRQGRTKITHAQMQEMAGSMFATGGDASLRSAKPKIDEIRAQSPDGLEGVSDRTIFETMIRKK